MIEVSRVMGLDVGDVRIGIALSDLSRTIASPLESYRRKGFVKDIDYILALAKEREVGRIVSGLPLSMDGSENAQSAKVREFMEVLRQHTELPVEFIDERFTTVSAERLLIQADVSREGRRKVVDKIAAAIILDHYLSRSKARGE